MADSDYAIDDFQNYLEMAGTQLNVMRELWMPKVIDDPEVLKIAQDKTQKIIDMLGELHGMLDNPDNVD